MDVRTMNGPHRYEWTHFEEAFMRANFMKLTNSRLADMLGHKRTLVRTKCYDMGLKRMEMEYWTDEQVKFLKENYKLYGDSELAEIFELKWKKEKGWSKKHIEKKRRYLKLERTKNEKAAIHERNVQMGRFALCPVNAWKKRGVAEVGERRIWNQAGRDFCVIKMKDGWVHYAPWLYAQLYGNVPDGCVVRLKDGSQYNVVPGNLELITMAENGARNSRTRLPEELKELKKLSNQLTKVIYERGDRSKVAKYA